MEEIADDFMRDMIKATRKYTACILRRTSKRNDPEAEKVVWEHGRRNFELRAEGVLPIVCPVTDGSEVTGVGIFNATVEETRRIMDADPGVRAGIFTYELHDCRGFPGSSLP